MKKLKCSLAVILAISTAALFGSCTVDQSWSYKDDLTTESLGTYIYYNYSAFQKASQKVEDSSGDFLSQEITDDDDNKMTAREYIAKEADLGCKNMLNVEKKFKEMGLSLTEEEQKAAETNASSGWMYNKTIMEGYGISEESFTNAYALVSAKYEKIFKTLYGEGGEKEVSQEELSKYFLDNYTNYSYWSVPLYESTTDESTGTSSSTAKSDDDIKKIKDSLDSYAKAINEDGKSFEDQVKAYMSDYSVESDPSTSNVEILDDSSLGEELVKALKEMKDKEAKVIKVGDDNASAVYYLLYKAPVSEKAETLSSDEDFNYKVLVNMKSDEFVDEMDKEAAAVECEINEAAISKYPVEMFINKDSSSSQS